jgi:hypothetical protein
MGNRRRIGEGSTGTTARSASTVSAPRREPPASPPPGPRGDSTSPCGLHDGAGLDACIQELVDAAPPLTGEQRDTLALLLRRPRRR